MRTTRFILSCAAALSVASATGCADLTGPGRTQLVLNRAKWADAGPATYTYQYQRAACECLPEWVQPVRIAVANGAVTAVTLVATGDTVPPPAFRFTVDSLFGVIEGAFASGAEDVTVTYDSQYGYPRAVYIDYDRRTADEEFGFWAELVDPS